MGKVICKAIAAVVAVALIGGSFSFVGGVLAWTLATGGQYIIGLALGSAFAFVGALSVAFTLNEISAA